MAYVANAESTMAEMFAHMGDVEFPQLVRGSARTIGEFYETVVSLNELDEGIVRAWWALLKRYCSRENERMIAFVRRYGNVNPRTGQRRGFLTTYESGEGFVYCDNAVADYFYAMAKARFVPGDDDFATYIAERQFPCAIRGVSEEYEERPDGRPRFQAYFHSAASKPKGLYKRWRTADGRPRDNKMWYLAHILDVDNPPDYPSVYGQRSDQVFSQGERLDWQYHDGEDYPSRKISGDMPEEDRRMLVAHFLRLACPLNYFLTPQMGDRAHRLQILRVPGRPEFRKGIQDLQEMQDFMRNRRREQFGDLFAEYEELTMALPGRDVPNVQLWQVPIDLRYCPPDEFLEGGPVREENRPADRPVISRRRSTSAGNAETAPTLVLHPAGVAEFKARLLETRRAQRVLRFRDGTERTDVWRADKLTAESDILFNIKTSGYWKQRSRTGLVSVELTVIGDARR